MAKEFALQPLSPFVGPGGPERAFSQSELFSIFSASRLDRNLPRNMNQQTCFEALRPRTKMSGFTLVSPDEPSLVRYPWGNNAAPVSLALAVKRNGFLSHRSAM